MVYHRYKVIIALVIYISARMTAVMNSLVHTPIRSVEGSFFPTSPVCSDVNFSW